DGQTLNWSQIPLVAWKANAAEIPLIRRVKPLQDAINLMESAFENGMLEDPRNTILVVTNYDGTDLGELRRNLATYGAVKVRSDSSGPGGDVKTLNVELNAENYKTILSLFKQALIENARGYDAKDDRLSGNPNQMNIQSMYSDIDLDANATETEFQASFEQLLWFVNAHLANSRVGNFDGTPVKITFNRNILINQSDIIQQCKDSVGLVSDRTILAHHPFVDDVDQELAELKQQKQEDMQMYDGGTFPQHDNNGQEEMQK
ncbi:MAG TPA: phage portal protein, partial [Ruminococcaceae bacterium]|nr:phage portal protein [Oscillospiraceae bacterium]